MNQTQAAQKLGISLSMLSRIRTQERNPTLSLMMRVENAYGWPIGKQAEAHRDGVWLSQFETVLQKAKQ